MKHFRFRSNMKHSAYAAYDEKMKNESLYVCNTTLSALYYDLQSTPFYGLILDITENCPYYNIENKIYQDIFSSNVPDQL